MALSWNFNTDLKSHTVEYKWTLGKIKLLERDTTTKRILLDYMQVDDTGKQFFIFIGRQESFMTDFPEHKCYFDILNVPDGKLWQLTTYKFSIQYRTPESNWINAPVLVDNASITRPTHDGYCLEAFYIPSGTLCSDEDLTIRCTIQYYMIKKYRGVEPSISTVPDAAELSKPDKKSSRGFDADVEKYNAKYNWHCKDLELMMQDSRSRILLHHIDIEDTGMYFLVYIARQTERSTTINSTHSHDCYFEIRIGPLGKLLEIPRSQFKMQYNTTGSTKSDAMVLEWNHQINFPVDERTQFIEAFYIPTGDIRPEADLVVHLNIQYYRLKKLPVSVTKRAGKPKQRVSITPTVAELSSCDKIDVAKNLIGMYKAQKHCDITFRVGDSKIKAHVLILAAASPYFDAIFSDKNTKESLECSVDLSEDPDIKMETLKAFLDYMYGCKSIHELGDHAQQLILLAQKFDVQQLKSSCEHYLGNNLRPENAVDVLISSEKHGFKTLKARALSFIKANKGAVKKTPNARKLAEHPHLMFDLLF